MLGNMLGKIFNTTGRANSIKGMIKKKAKGTKLPLGMRTDVVEPREEAEYGYVPKKICGCSDKLAMFTTSQFLALKYEPVVSNGSNE